MRYIGGKTNMLDNIYQILNKKTKHIKSVLDLFAGSCAVSQFLKNKGFMVTTNDNLYFSYVLSRGTLCLNSEPKFIALGMDPLQYLNSLTLDQTRINLEQCFIYNNYTLNQHCRRMYFQPDNALKIDLIRITIETWKNSGVINDDEYFYLLASLISAVPFVANITGIYAAYLKTWERRSFFKLELKKPEIFPHSVCHALNLDAFDAVAEYYDLAYLDPPYNNRQYGANYHLLETIARYDYPELHGKTGLRNYDSSLFCNKKIAPLCFDLLFSKLKCRYLMLSYNNEGLIDTEHMCEMIKKHGNPRTFELFEYPYRRYMNKIPNRNAGLKEQIYFIEQD